MVFNEEKAIQFYENIRCSLLHEARTTGGWKIWAIDSELSVDFSNHVVYRNKLQDDLREYMSIYKKELLESTDLQKAFIRKFNALCK